MNFDFILVIDNCVSYREKHRELKSNMDRLHKVTVSGPDGKEFIEPKVSSLWKLAIRGDFTRQELESLHVSIGHLLLFTLKLLPRDRINFGNKMCACVFV